MQPTLKQGYLLLVNKLAYKLGEPEYGDVIVFHYNGDQQEDYIKRVIGLPGDEVDIRDGVVRVNGMVLTEPYIMEVPGYTGTWSVPEGSLFVLGDNRNHSSDSHQWGYVQMDWVVGKALYVYWPFEAIGSLSIKELVRAAPAN
jgi:signal peptidase I